MPNKSQVREEEESGLKRSARLRSKKVDSESQNDQGAIGMSLDVLAHVASETLKKEPNSSKKNEKNSLKRLSMRTIGSVEVLSLEQILGLTEKTVLNLFTESSANELAKTFTFTCQLIPKICHKQFTSFGSEMRARTEMKKHVYEHLSELEKDPESRSKFTAEPVHVRNKRLLSYNTAKKTPTKKTTKLPAPKVDLIRTKIIADSVYISDPCLQRKQKLVGFIPDPDKLESMAVSKDIFQEDFQGADKKCSEENERKIEENEQFIIELLSKTQPHHDHGYTTIFGKRKNSEHVDQLLAKVDSEPDYPDTGTSWKEDLNLKGMKKVIFIEPADSKRGEKKRPAPILFLRHRSPDENVPMVSAEEIIEEKTDGEEEEAETEDEYEEMSQNEDASETAPLSSGEKPYPPMPKSILARKGRLGFDIQDLSPEASDDEDFIKTRKKTNPLGREGREGNLGWEPKLALKFIKELKARKKDENIPLKCKICKDKTFTATATLMYHYRSHAGIKPFVCLICNTTFTRQHSLNYHMLIHNNQSRFTCKDCGRKFRHPSHFKEHLRRHTGETPFECLDCGQKFKTRNTYKRHLKTRHGKLLTATGIHLLSQEEFAKVRTKRYHIPKLLPDIGYKMPELTFTKLKRKQTGELEKVEEEKLTRSEIVDDSMIFEELKADIKKEAESGNESDPELVDILEVLSQTATGDNNKGIQTEKDIKQEPLSDSDKTSKPCTTVIYVNNVGGSITHTAGLVNIK
ncbi:uncharacterized protein LOC123563837 [Mercenaria mercenaria]|uniref:uncharacterized protein LOC123563837 n=1 Tax=Mercenaria mercenaria TaxID=6596 RepID=UPI00234E6F05|nr:uncharacterized protein LOC123563837 [Mercenaria mercenaria]